MFAVLLLIATLPAISQPTSGIRLNASFGWALDLRLGFEVPLNESFTLRADAGVSLFSLEGAFALSYGLTGVWHCATLGEALDLGIAVGIPDAMIVFSDTASFMFSFGSAVVGRYYFPNRLYGDLCLGAGYPLFIEDGELRWGRTAFFELWPNARLGIGYEF